MKCATSLLALLVAAGLSACAVGPDYRAPQSLPATQSGTSFANAEQTGLVEQPVAIRFWSGFADTQLDQLVSESIAANHDLRIAAANLRAARALRRLTGYDRYPTVTAEAGYTHGLQSESQLPGFDRDTREGDRYDAGFDAIWELDVFGRVRRGVEAARADEEAGLAGLQDAQVIVTAEVARNYLVLRGLQDQLGVARRNAENQTRSLGITRTRLEAGRGNELDTARAEAQLRTTQANIPVLEAAIARSIQIGRAHV